MQIAIDNGLRFDGNAALADSIQNWIEAQDVPITVRRIFYAMVVVQAEIEKLVDAESFAAIIAAENLERERLSRTLGYL